MWWFETTSDQRCSATRIRVNRIRRRGQVEAAGPVGLDQIGGLAGLAAVVFGPGRPHAVQHDLHRMALCVGDEGRAQRLVPIDQSLCGTAQPGRIDAAGEVEDGLTGVDVDGGGGQFGVEQQTGLQRGQRPHLRDLAEAPLPAVDIALADAHQREVRRGVPTRTGRFRVPRNGFQRPRPEFAEFAYGVGVEQRGRIADPRGQPVADHDGVDVQRRHRRHIGVVVAGQFAEFRGGNPAEAAQRPGTALSETRPR